jgi:hypothetical protein
MPLPAVAHGDALAFAMVQLGLYAALLVLTPILCAKGDRLGGFLITLMGYPAVLYVVGMLTCRLFDGSPDADNVWGLVMYAVSVGWVVGLVRVRVWRRKRSVEGAHHTVPTMPP